MSGVGLPPGWVRTTLSQIGDVVSGATPKTSIADYWGGDIPWITPDDLSKNPAKTTRSGRRFITQSGYDSCSTRRVPAGSVLFSSRAPIGYVTIAGDALCTNQGFKTVVPTPAVSSEYLYWYLQYATPSISARASGTTFKEISGKYFAETEIVLPPLAEQHRIVEAIEDHLSRLDAADHSLASAQARSTVLQRSTIERAMNGGFLAEKGEDEPVSELLAKIAADLAWAATGRRRKPMQSHRLSPYAKPPRHWSVQPLGALARTIEYGTSAKAHSDPCGNDVPVLRMGNIRDGVLDMQDLKYLSIEHPDVSRLLLNDGDLLFNRTNSAELVGKSAVYRSSLGQATFASYLIRCQFADGVEPEWVSLCINSPEGRRYVNSVAAQQVGQANVNGTKLAAFPIPLPPHGEQLRLLAELSDWRDTVKRTSGVTHSALKRSAHLRRALLRRAFAGALVPQDPTDEPASALLNRIRAEREARNSGKSAVKRAPRRSRKATATADAPPPPSTASTPAPTTAVQQELPL
ncbi:restriction endonuclease subunit S [Streptomyces murinus]|uniref:restriction endonuclease subunit S n=1 Tax=Streptomyces murinus TaxID=33900 RepID=UPI00381F3657